MGSRRTSTADNGATSASISKRLQTPPRVQRQLDKATRVLTSDAVEAARHQRQLDALVLTQIVARAERIRQRARSHGKTPSGRALDESQADEADAWSEATPLTLIELIQASSAVFDKHGIRPPQDAMYHRFLLTLSMDPERDWKLKIQKFAATQQPRVKRLSAVSATSGGGSVVGGRRGSVMSEASVKAPARRRTAVSERVKTPQRDSERGQETQAADRFGDVLLASNNKSPKPRTPSVTSKENQMRNASVSIAMEKTEVEKETLERKLRGLWRMRAKLEDLTEDLTLETDEKDNGDGDEDDNEQVAAVERRLQARRELQDKQERLERLQSLERQKLQELQERQERQERQDICEVQETREFHESCEFHELQERLEIQEVRKLQERRELHERRRRQHIREQEELVEEDDVADDEEEHASSSHDGGESSPVSPLPKLVSAPVDVTFVPRTSRRVSMGTFKLLATSFQQWKELMAFHRLVRESRAREMRLTQSILPPAATFAVFRWIALALPSCDGVISSESRAIPAFVVSRGIAVANSPLLRHFTGRLLVWTLRRILHAWAKDARATKTVRIKSMIRRRTHVLETAVECMRQWQIYAEQRKRVRDHGVWVETLHLRRCLRGRWRLWRAAVVTQRRNTSISASYGHKRTRKVFFLWAQWVKMQRTTRRLGSRARLRRVLIGWRKATKEASEEDRLVQRANALYRRRVLAKCWRPWKEKRKDNKSVREKLVKWNRSQSLKRKRLWWAAWRQVHASTRMLHAKCARFVRWRVGRELRIIVSAWAAYTQRRRQCELLVMDAVSRREERVVRKVWSAWSQHFETTMKEDDAKIHKLEATRRAEIWRSWKRQTSTRRVLTKLRFYSNHGLSALVWKNWRAFVERQKHYRAIVEAWRGDRDETTKHKAFEALVENWQSSHKKQQVARAFTSEGSRKRLRVCLWAWQKVAVVRRGQHQEDNELVTVWRHQRTQQLWQMWRQAFHVAQCVHLADKSMMKGLQKRYWASWRSFVRSKRDQALVKQNLQVFLLRRSLSKWRLQLAKKRSLLRLKAAVADQSKGYLLAKGWRGWRDSLSLAKVRHARVAQAVFTWRTRRLVAFYKAWKTVHIKRKAHKLLLASWWRAAQDRSVRSCWKAWLSYIEGRHESRQVVAEAAQYCVQRNLKTSIQIWRRCCERSREKLRVMHRCLDQWAGNQRREKFLRWLQFVHNRGKCREMDGIARVKSVSKTFKAWETWKTVRDLRHLNLVEVTSRLDQWKIKRSLRKLRLNALTSKRMNSVLNLIKLAGSRGQQVVIFRRWTTYMCLRKQQRSEFEASTRALQRFRQQRCVRQWSSFLRVKTLLVSTLLKAQARTSTAIVGKIFGKWRQFVADRKLFHSLRQKALVFRVFSILPIYFFAWKQFVHDQRHRKQLILKASRLLCHHQEALAFKAWGSFTILKRQSRRALHMWRNQTLIQIFRQWKGLRAMELTKAKAGSFYESALRRRVLREWRKDAHRKRLLRHFTQLWHTQTTQTCFSTWVKHARVQRCARMLLQRLQNASLGRVFNSWKSLIQSRLQLSGTIQQRFLLLWNQDRQMTCFQRWKAFKQQQQMLKARLHRRLQQQTTECFVRWRALVEKSRRSKRLVDAVAHLHAEQITRGAWILWRRQKRTRDAVNGLRNRILNRTSDAFVKRLFGEWRGIVAKSKLVNAMFSRLKNAVIGRVFTAWRHAYLAQRRRERSLTVHVRKLCAQRVLGKVLAKMKSRVALKRACLKVFLPLIQRHVLSQVWGSWYEYHVRQQETKARVAGLQDELERTHPVMISLLSVSIRRWKAPDQARCFTHWLVMVKHQKWMRTKTAEALQFWQTRHCKAFFTAWSAWKDRHKWKRSICERNATHRRVRAWRQWLSYHQHQRVKTLMRKKAIKLRQKRVQVAVIYAWRQRLAAQRHCKLVEAALMLRRTRCSLSFWHRQTVEMRAHRLQLTVASVAFNHTILQSMWQQWAEYVRLVRTNRQELQQNTERLQVLELCSTFRAWQAWSHRQHKINHVVALLSGRCSANTARCVLHAWHRNAKASKGRRDQTDSFAYAMNVRRGLRALRGRVEDRKSHQNTVVRANKWTDLLHSRHTERVFRRWKRFALLCAQSKRVVYRYHMEKLLPRVLEAWKGFVQTCQLKRQRLTKALNCWQSIYTRRAWKAWACFRLLRQKTRQAKLVAVEFRTRRQLLCVLLAWRSVVVKKKLMGESCRKLLVRWRLQTAYRCFMSWQSDSLQRKTMHVSSAIVTQQLIMRSLRSAWSEWRRQYIVVQVGKRKQLLRAWSRWTRWLNDRHEWRDFQNHQRDVLLRTVCARHGIQQWKQFVLQAKLGKTVAILSLRFQKDTLMKRVFERWLQFLVVRHKEKDKMKRVLVWFHQRQLMQTFQALARHANYRKAKKEQAVRATQYHHRRTTSSVFHAWHKTVAVISQQRLKLRQYVDVMQHLTQRKSFFAWREFAARRVELKANCAALLSQRTLLTTQSVFQQWQRFTAKVQSKKTAGILCKARLYRNSWRQWHCFVVLTKMERMLGASEQRLLEGSFVEWRKKASLGKSTRLFSEQRQLREDQERVQTVLKAWRQWSHIQAKCSNLLANVAVGNHLRFRFLMWKQFTAKSTRLKRLVHGVECGESPLGETITSGAEGEFTADQTTEVVVTPSLQLARMARFFQRFEVEWGELSTVWQRWRHLFHARLFYRIRRVHKCFMAWQARSQRRRFVRKVLTSRLYFRRQTELKVVLTAWCHVIQTVKQIQQERRRERELWVIVNTEILRRERKTLQQHWNAWRERVEDKQHLLVSVSAYQRARILTKFWLLWSHDFGNAMKRERRNERRRLDAINTLKKTRAVRELSEFARRHRHVRITLATLRHQREARLCSASLEIWQAITTVRRRVRLLIAFKKRQRLRIAMMKWVKWLDARHQQQRNVEKYVCDRQKRVRLDAFTRWHRYLRHRQRVDETNVVAMTFRLRCLIHKRWRRAVQSNVRARVKGETAELAIVTWKQRRFLSRWHRTSRHQRLQRKMHGFILRKFMALWKGDTQHAVAVRFETFQHHKLAGVVICQWHTVAARRVWRRRVEAEVTNAHQTRVSRQFWCGWLDFVETKRKKQLAHTHYNDVVKLKWFLHWSDAAKHLQQQREEKFAVADDFHARKIARRVLETLAQTVQANQQRRAVLLICMVKIQRALHSRVQHVVFKAWADAADRSHYGRECGVLLEQSRLRRSLATWQRTITDRKRSMRTQRDADAYHRQRLLSVRFFQWQNYALAWKDAERVKTTTPPRPKAPPPPPIQTTRPPTRAEEENDEDESFRHPLSPITKRFQAKKQAKMLHEVLDVSDQATPPVPSFSDAASLSLDVKKRLMVLGKWKPTHKSLHQA